MEPQPTCPVCGKRDQNVAVRMLYFAGIQIKRTSTPNAPTVQTLPASFLHMPERELVALSRRLKPPQSSQSPGLRPVHPDLVVLAFSLFVPFFVFKIYETQPASTLPVIALLVTLYGIYIWRRANILHAFKIEENRYLERGSRNERAVQRWMDLHYCKCEDIIFNPKENLYYPVDQITYYLQLN